jgi:acetyl esterase/lipase
MEKSVKVQTRAKVKKIIRIVIIAIVAVVLVSTIGTLSSVWVGHIPKKYDYNDELPKASNVMSWTNINSSIVQNSMKKTIAQKAAEFETYKIPDGFSMDIHSVQVDGGTINMYSIEPTSLVGKKDVPVLLYIHGGAFYFPLTVDAMNIMLYYAENLGAKVFLPDYRTSIDNPFPVPLQDCYASALYIENKAEELGIDINRLIIYGDSAGGCLAAGVTQYIRDYGGQQAKGQFLVYPVLDNSMDYKSMQEYKDAPWPLNANENMWEVYLKNGGNGQLKYAAPLQSDNFANLPQTYIEAAEMDILHDEALVYANKLEKAGVKVETYEVQGGYHGFDSDQSNPLVKKILEKRVNLMKEMIGGK